MHVLFVLRDRVVRRVGDLVRVPSSSRIVRCLPSERICVGFQLSICGRVEDGDGERRVRDGVDREAECRDAGFLLRDGSLHRLVGRGPGTIAV